jgi:hypothetical protein
MVEVTFMGVLSQHCGFRAAAPREGGHLLSRAGGPGQITYVGELLVHSGANGAGCSFEMLSRTLA